MLPVLEMEGKHEIGKAPVHLVRCALGAHVLTYGVLVEFDGSAVHLSQGLHLYVVAIALVLPLAVDVVLKILVSDVLRKEVSVLQLKE